MRTSFWLADAADLLLGHVCLGCGELGRELCGDCLRALRGRGRILSGHPPMVAAADYNGLAGAVVLAYKEDGHRSLAAPLGALLADAIAATSAAWQLPRLVLVRVPGHRRSRRGFDALGGVLRHARYQLSERGLSTVLLPAIVMHADYEPAKSLSRTEREQNVTNAFRARLQAGAHDPPVVIVDDVATTGATLREADRALTAAGHVVAGAAVICAVSPDT